MESLFLEPITFSEAKSTDTRAMGFWTDARTHGHNFEKTIFQNPFPRLKSNKKGGGKNTRAFCLGRMESIPAVYQQKRAFKRKEKQNQTFLLRLFF